VLGGSRVNGSSDAQSDWDLGVHYRGTIDLTALGARGEVYPPGSRGRLMNGGAWLTVGGEVVDVLLRDLDTVDHWTRRAQDGKFEIDALLGHIAGVPTYILTAELALSVPLRGAVTSVTYPPRLVEAAPPIWRFCRSFSLECARSYARRGNRIGAIGQAAKAVMEEAHARLCERSAWVCNEKRMVEAAGLAGAQRLFEQTPAGPEPLRAWLDRVDRELGAPTAMPWRASDATA
jgi:hypothetical protein